MEDPMLTAPWAIRRLKRETDDTFTLMLEPTEAVGQPGLEFKPGQFNMLYVFGIGEVPISISGDPGSPEILQHTTRVVGTVTAAMSKLGDGDCLGVRGPFGSDWPAEKAVGKDVVIIAGGIGLAPLRPLIFHLLAHRDQYHRVVLLYGARTPEEILYRKYLETWSAKLDINVFVTVDRATQGWHGSVGVVTPLIRRVPFDPANAVSMVCGPEIMMRFAVQELQRRGMSGDDIYISMERNMKCAIGHCGHCQYGPNFICKDGPVFTYNHVSNLLDVREV